MSDHSILIERLLAALDPLIRRLGIKSDLAALRLAAMLEEARPRRLKPQEDATLVASRTLDGLVTRLHSLTRDAHSIRWERESVKTRWIEAASLVRALDRSLAVQVYSYYATDPETVRYLLDREPFDGAIWEPCSGDGAIARELEVRGHVVYASDIRDHPGIYGCGGVDLYNLRYAANVVTNPPFWNALPIAEHLISITERKVALLLKVEFQGSISRRSFFRQHPPARLYPLARRPEFRIAGKEDRVQGTSWDYAWYVWERGYGDETKVIY